VTRAKPVELVELHRLARPAEPLVDFPDALRDLLVCEVGAKRHGPARKLDCRPSLLEQGGHSWSAFGIEPSLRIPEPVYLNGYPEELAALSNTERGLAKRFELYWNGLELANGYEELRNKEEHLRRFKEFNDIRRKTGRPEMKGDPQFLENIEKMPECSGIALGVERLMMVFLGENHIANISPFAWPK
jgi:hypothetical protein